MFLKLACDIISFDNDIALKSKLMCSINEVKPIENNHAVS